MPNDNIDNERTGISRREFASRVGLAAAAAVVGPALHAAPLPGARVRGAQRSRGAGEHRHSRPGQRPQARLRKAEERRDQDALRHRREPRSRAHQRHGARRCPDLRPGFEQDLRRVFDDKDIDGVIIATPNHWHALATIWALQAGKHVYVEKPAAHTVAEGRRMVEAARRYNKVVQVGTMNRSRPVVRQAIKFIHEGGIGKVYMARGLCFKPRPAIGKYPDGPMAPGEKYRLNVEAKTAEPTYDTAYLSKVNYDLWLGPAPARAFQPQPLPLQLALALGLRRRRHRQPGPAPVRHRALGPPEGRAPGDHQRHGRLLRTGVVAGDARTSTPRSSGTPTAPCWSSPRAASTPTTRARRRIGNLFYGTEGWVWIDGDGRKWQSYRGWKDEKGPGSDAPPEQGGSDPRVLTSIESPHYQNFVDALRAEDRKLLTCDIHEGHLTADAAAAGEHRLPRRAPAHLRRQDRDVRERQGSRPPALARVPQGLRGQRDDVGTDHPAMAVGGGPRRPLPTVTLSTRRQSGTSLRSTRGVPSTARRGPIQNGSSAGRPSGRNAVVAR